MIFLDFAAKQRVQATFGVKHNTRDRNCRSKLTDGPLSETSHSFLHLKWWSYMERFPSRRTLGLKTPSRQGRNSVLEMVGAPEKSSQHSLGQFRIWADYLNDHWNHCVPNHVESASTEKIGNFACPQSSNGTKSSSLGPCGPNGR
jgi:hypothetical protein